MGRIKSKSDVTLDIDNSRVAWPKDFDRSAWRKENRRFLDVAFDVLVARMTCAAALLRRGVSSDEFTAWIKRIQVTYVSSELHIASQVVAALRDVGVDAWTDKHRVAAASTRRGNK